MPDPHTLAPCHCDASTARDGHIHEADDSVLCLHHEGEDGSNCPQRPTPLADPGDHFVCPVAR